MKQVTWDFSRFGLSSGVVAFVVSVIKTAAVAALVAAGAKLASYPITGSVHHVEILTSLVVIIRALVSGSVEWLQNAPVASGATVTETPTPVDTTPTVG